MRARAALAGLALALATGAQAEQSTGAAFLQIPSSPRAYALGMSETVTALGAEAVGNNPANIGLIENRFEAFTSYASMMTGSQYEHVAAAFAPVRGSALDGMGLSVTRLESGGLAGADASGNQTGATFGASDMAVTASLAGRLSSALRLGGTLRMIQSQIANYKSNMALAGDFGATYTLHQGGRPISFGASLINIGSGMKFIDQTDRLPTALNVGVAVPLGPIMAVGEINRGIYSQRTEFGTGFELTMGVVQFRAGFLQASDSRQNLALQDQSTGGRFLTGLAGGVGLRFGPARIDYAVSANNGLAAETGPSQHVALTIRWGDRTAHSRGGAPASLGNGSHNDSSWMGHPDRSDWLIRGMGTY